MSQESRYAIYAVVVEDSEENDLYILGQGIEFGERIAGDLHRHEAGQTLVDIRADYGNNRIARDEAD